MKIYDIEIDDFRPAEQSDIDNFGVMNRAIGKIVTGSRSAKTLQELQDLISAELGATQKEWKRPTGEVKVA